MAKATLEFDLTDPDDRNAHQRAVLADDVFSCLYSVLEEIRQTVKYGAKGDVAGAEKVRQIILRELEERGIDLNKLWS